MADNSNSPHVLIIGAGLAGLALAQALRARNYTFQVFDRDVSEENRSQGWCITLHGDLLDSFARYFPSDMPDLDPVDHLYGTGIETSSAVYHASRNLLKELVRFGPKLGNRQIRANRGKLRSWLMTNVSVQWGKQFVRYEEDASGVTAYFQDGSQFHGDIIVGADGIHSRVRAQLVPEVHPGFLPMGVICGELEAPKEQYERWMQLGTSWVSAFSADLRVTYLVSSIAEDGKKAKLYWLFGWQDEDALKEEFWTSNASREEMHQFVHSQLPKLHPQIAAPFQATPVEGIVLPPLRLCDMLPLVLPAGRVSLIGDAVHSMTPFRGQGGNVAMADGMSLARLLNERGASQSLSDVLRLYEEEMRPRAMAAVLESRGGAYEANAQKTTTKAS
ncbi:monooxygenase FAD-binding protein-like protein [Lojkania enalia]|uniref:Monooxygenase FAD-binding protein-like protein n=1 Tax=Lojkania enalia TaxID=147567 RepID=A0A9P4JY25_9PLEO|nr:monooxygenase FAD-binding protein-like protein [Didymosphaeria enalia]